MCFWVYVYTYYRVVGRISYIGKSPYEISRNNAFRGNVSYKISSEWQLYQPEKIWNGNVYIKLFRFRKKLNV